MSESHLFDDLTDDNFLLYAAKAYARPNGCVTSEFEEDLLRIKYIKRLFKRARLTGNLKERLILNHIIVLGNVFGWRAASRICFFKLSEGEENEMIDWPALKSFLLFLNVMPESLGKIRGKHIESQYIGTDQGIFDKLNSL